MASAEVIHGDCLDVMRGMPDASIDAVVTDPPYGLSFMGKDWDHGVPGVPFWEAALRVAKPGSYLLAFGGTRTSHRLTCAIEDAGWEIPDALAFFSSTEPLFRALWDTLDAWQREAFAEVLERIDGGSALAWLYGSGFPKHKSKLKPAYEPIVMARKPAPKATLLNIDDCRIEGEPRTTHAAGNVRTSDNTGVTMGTGYGQLGEVREGAAGRWPANVLLDEEAAAALDEQSGECGGSPGIRNNRTMGYGRNVDSFVTSAPGDTGGASRFFYCAKASRSEREAGLGGAARRNGGSNAKGFTDDVARGLDRNRPVANHHPTVKPVALMRWLVRLVAPPDGVVLDPFTGSGTTGIAATLEGRRFVGIEREAEYVDIARARIAHIEAQTLLAVHHG